MDASLWDARYRETARLWSGSPNVFVEDRLRTSSPGLGLDLAAGEGRNSVWLAEQGWQMTAVDFSEVAIERGREWSDQVEFVYGDVTTWESDRRFDLVLIAYLHLPEEVMESVVRRASAWLSPGGEIFMVGHDRSNIEHGHGGPQVLQILWDVDVYVAWLDDLRLVETAIVRRPVETEEGVRYALDTLIRAKRN